MQDSSLKKDFIVQENIKNCFDKSNVYREIRQKNFVNGLRNARTLLHGLEKSLQKTKKYEKKLIKCRTSHSHVHNANEWWESDYSEEKSRGSKTGTAQSSRSRVDLAESWSTMSIVCLQYQYEELTKRYSSLLQAYNERCGSLTSREATLARLRQRVRMTHSRLAHAHRTLIVIGEKYLALREKKIAQKNKYEAKIRCLNRAMCHVIDEAERTRFELDVQLEGSMETERDGATALLLDEIRKCNVLFLENLKLKAQLETIAPGNVDKDS